MQPRRHLAPCATISVGLAVCTALLTPGTANPDTPSAPVPSPPATFTRFQIDGEPELSAALNDFTWRHFAARPGTGRTLFNKEYLVLADMWLNATDPRSGRSIQDVHRDTLLRVELDPEGYVHSHQHFSHAHDHGWPFPVWPQASRRSGQWIGLTAGWLFQERPNLRGWAADYLRKSPALSRWYGAEAAAAWRITGGTSHGIVDRHWRVDADAADAEANVVLSWPDDTHVEATAAPFVQIRWRPGKPPAEGFRPHAIFRTAADPALQRVEFPTAEVPGGDGLRHTHLAVHRHPAWRGTITHFAIHLPAAAAPFDIDSIFTCHDTRHQANNAIFVIASAEYFRWTQDHDFLSRQMGRLRRAVRYMDTQLHGRELGRIRVDWPGHDGLPGFRREADGSKTLFPGQGIGGNYWDLMPFGWDDFHATSRYYAALVALARLERLVAAHPEWNIPAAEAACTPQDLEAHAARVRTTANELFWNEETGRYVAAIDRAGTRHDYGYTVINLEAIWHGIVPADRARSIMDWISGRRIVAGDTSTGADIYRWRFAPRTSTVRNIDWYGHAWHDPEAIPWGGQVQDGGAVLGFSFFDLWARLQVYGAADAYARLAEILAWEREVQAAGGYRAAYADGKRGGTLQGCGTPGGLGVDCEFAESSLVSAFVVLGLIAADPSPDGLICRPGTEAIRSIPQITVHDIRYAGSTSTLSTRESTAQGQPPGEESPLPAP